MEWRACEGERGREVGLLLYLYIEDELVHPNRGGHWFFAVAVRPKRFPAKSGLQRSGSPAIPLPMNRIVTYLGRERVGVEMGGLEE